MKISENMSVQKCQICDKRFGRAGYLKVHIRNVHPGKSKHENKREHQCLICGLAYKQKNCLETHIKLVHENIKENKCLICNKAFGERSNLNRHSQIHTDIIKEKC